MHRRTEPFDTTWRESSESAPVLWNESLLIGPSGPHAAARLSAQGHPRVLLVGHGHDPDLATLAERLTALGAHVRTMLVDRVAHYPTAQISGASTSETYDVGYCRSIAPADTIQYHFDRTARRSSDWSTILPNRRNHATEQANTLLWWWLGRQRVAHWINSPWSLRTAENKLLQLSAAAESGLRIPDTVVTNDVDELRAFARSHRGEVVHKSLGSPVISRGSTSSEFLYTTAIDVDTVTAIPYPSLFQHRLRPLEEIRVTFIGDRVFSASIPRQGGAEPDWRRSTVTHSRFEHHDLPRESTAAIRALMGALEIQIGSVDLIKTEQGLHFLEVNPSAALLWLERSLGMKLCDTLATTILSAQRLTKSSGKQED